MAKKVITFTVQPPCSTASRKQPTSLHILGGSLLKFHFILIEFDFQVSCIKETMCDFFFLFFPFLSGLHLVGKSLSKTDTSFHEDNSFSSDGKTPALF